MRQVQFEAGHNLESLCCLYFVIQLTTMMLVQTVELSCWLILVQHVLCCWLFWPLNLISLVEES